MYQLPRSEFEVGCPSVYSLVRLHRCAGWPGSEGKTLINYCSSRLRIKAFLKKIFAVSKNYNRL